MKIFNNNNYDVVLVYNGVKRPVKAKTEDSVHDMYINALPENVYRVVEEKQQSAKILTEIDPYSVNTVEMNIIDTSKLITEEEPKVKKSKKSRKNK